MGMMAAMAQRWRGVAALLTIGAIVALGLFLVLRPLRLDTPASESGQALLRLDNELGATVEPIDRAMAAKLGLKAADRDLVVTSIASGGPAAEAGLRVGDVIERIDGHPASDELVHVAKATSIEPLSIRRGDKVGVINVQLAGGSGD